MQERVREARGDRVAREQRTEIERQREICLSCQQNVGEDNLGRRSSCLYMGDVRKGRREGGREGGREGAQWK